jgi:tetratricopeptide (TPR) repeat protein
MKTSCLLLFIGIALAFAAMSLVKGVTEAAVKSADESYQKGEKASTIAERKESFNRALTLYKKLEESNQPQFGNGKLYYNLGNTYFQLEEYPWAILYYNKALSLMPRTDKIEGNLALAKQKLGIPQAAQKTLLDKIFFFHTKLALPERLQLFFLFGLFTFITASLYIWQRQRWLKQFGLLSGFFSLLFLFSLAYTHYFSPISAVIVKASKLYRDAGKQYATLSDQLLPSGLIPPGSQVVVLNVYENGKWLKIRTADGVIGFVPYEVIRII